MVKRVPATDSKIKVGPDGKSIDPAGLDFVLNPYDEHALEQALQTKESQGGSVTVMCYGPPEAKKDLRTCLAMGADKAILLQQGTEQVDGLSLSILFAEKVKEQGYEIVFCGTQSVDNDEGQIGPRLASLLSWACVTDASSFEVLDGGWRASRDIEGGKEALSGGLPVVVTCSKGLNEPRYPNLKGIMAAKKKPLEELEAVLTESQIEVVALTPPPQRPAPSILGEGPDAVTALMDKLQNEAKVL